MCWLINGCKFSYIGGAIYNYEKKQRYIIMILTIKEFQGTFKVDQYISERNGTAEKRPITTCLISNAKQTVPSIQRLCLL